MPKSCRGRALPSTYVPTSLSRRDRKRHLASICKGTDRPKVASAPSRPSKWTLAARAYFGERPSLRRIADQTGAPLAGLNAVLRKGRGAYYSSGSRPNQTQASWARARLYSVLFGGAARRTDQAIVDKYGLPKLRMPSKTKLAAARRAVAAAAPATARRRRRTVTAAAAEGMAGAVGPPPAAKRPYTRRSNGAKVCTKGYGGGTGCHRATHPLPKRTASGTFVFKDAPTFRPNVAPWEVLRAGAFGGTYFRTIKSGITGRTYRNAHKEFPAAWFSGMNIAVHVASKTYRKAVNKYGVKCGTSLAMWESKQWIVASAPFGWFQWYCRFFMGLRTPDDARQIKRWRGVAGLPDRTGKGAGRWVRNLATKIAARRAKVNDASVSPVIRQVLLHWGYRLTAAHYRRLRK